MSTSDIIAAISLGVSSFSAFYAWRISVANGENQRFSSVRTLIMQVYDLGIDAIELDGEASKNSAESAGRAWTRLNAECNDFLEYKSHKGQEALLSLMENFHEQCVDSGLVSIAKGSAKAIARKRLMSESRQKLVWAVRKQAKELAKFGG